MISRSCDCAVLTFTKLSPLETFYAPVSPETGWVDWWMARDLFSENTSSSLLAGTVPYYRPNNVCYKLTKWRPLLASPSPSINYLFVWIIVPVPVLISKRLNIQKTIYVAQLFSWSDWAGRFSRVQVSIELLTMHHYYWTQVPLIPWYVTMIYKKTFLDFLTIELRDFLYFISVPSVPFLLKSFWTSLYLLSFTIWFLPN